MPVELTRCSVQPAATHELVQVGAAQARLTGRERYFLRALNCGAIGLPDIEQTGLTPAEVELRSFAKILAARRARLGVPLRQ